MKNITDREDLQKSATFLKESKVSPDDVLAAGEKQDKEKMLKSRNAGMSTEEYIQRVQED